MGTFELLVKVVINETMTSEDPKRLCPLWRYKLGNAATMLWANNHNSIETVWKDHTTHLQAVTQAISEQECWETILDELQTNETLTESARRQQTTYLKTKIYENKIKLHEAIETANAHAVPQDQHEPAYTNSERQKRTESKW